MTRSGTINGSALLVAGSTASSQSVKPYARGFLIAAPEDLNDSFASTTS